MKRLFEGIIALFAGIMIGVKFAEKVLSKALRKTHDEASKFQLLLQMMGAWVELKQKGIDVAQYFKGHGYKRIAIYGMSLAGQTLYNELNGKDVQVLYAIDKNKNGVSSEIEVYSPEELLPKVDVIVVSAIAYYEEISDMLQERVDCAIVSLEDIIYSLRQ